MTAPPHVQLDKSSADAAICHEAHEIAHSGDRSPQRAAICHFEQVRGRGDREILRLAELQHGLIHRFQLLDAGMGRGALSHRLHTGWLRVTFPSVYRVGGAGETRRGQTMAAALYFRGYAVAADVDAAGLWQMLDSTQQPKDGAAVHVLLVAPSYRPQPGIRIHRAQTLARQDIRVRNGIPVTSPARTVLDLAGSFGELELEAAMLIALRKQGLRMSQLQDVIARNPYAKGVARLRALLDQPQTLRDTRSLYERRLLMLLREAELPLPVTNVSVAGHLVDALWPDLKLVVEFDGWRYHGDRPRFETDRLRDQHLAATGHQAIRITARQIDDRPYALVARIASVITTLRSSAVLEAAPAARWHGPI